MQTFVKHLGYTSHKGGKASKGTKAIKSHIKYIENRVDELGKNPCRELFGREGEMTRQDFYKTINEQPNKGVIAHKLVISMDRKDYDIQNMDLKQLARDTMSQWEAKTGRQFNWVACIHDKASNPHVHIVVAGRDTLGKEVIFKPNHLEQFKRVADKERERLFNINISRDRIEMAAPLRGFEITQNILKQISKEKDLEKDFHMDMTKNIQKTFDQAREILNPKEKQPTRSISKGFER